MKPPHSFSFHRIGFFICFVASVFRLFRDISWNVFSTPIQLGLFERQLDFFHSCWCKTQRYFLAEALLRLKKKTFGYVNIRWASCLGGSGGWASTFQDSFQVLRAERWANTVFESEWFFSCPIVILELNVLRYGLCKVFSFRQCFSYSLLIGCRQFFQNPKSGCWDWKWFFGRLFVYDFWLFIV